MLASLTTVMMACALTASAPADLKWEADYGKALEQTRADDRPLLIVIDNPNADAEQAPESLVGKQEIEKSVLRKYDLCRVDVTTDYGKAVAKVFKAKTFPYVAIIDKTGSVILHSQSGPVSEYGDRSDAHQAPKR